MVFVAYGSEPAAVGEVIESGCKIADRFSASRSYHTWKQNDIVGLDLVTPIIQHIEAAPYVVADISGMNANVVYEIGYAIGCGKRVVIVRHKDATVSNDELNRIGLFDTLGYSTYETDVQFASIVSEDRSEKVIPIEFEKNRKQPLYLVSCAEANEISHRILSRIKKTRLTFRSFTPSEDIRLSAQTAIENVASSFGLVLDWRNSVDEVAFRHNIRTAFVAGLGHALGIETIIFAPPQSNVPLDFRNSSFQVARHQDVDDGISTFVPGVNEAFQTDEPSVSRDISKLAEISLGDPAAENELGSLHRYFLPSATYAAAIKGNVRTIVGRKGAGKTALWARIRNHVRSTKKSVVVDLKPEGYQLVRLREEVLKHLSFGQQLHLATAFWEYLLMLEVATKLVETDRILHTRNPRLTEGYQKLAELTSEYSDLGDTDFSERLHRLSEGLAGRLSEDRDVLTGNFNGATLTNKIYSIDIKNFRSCLFGYLAEKGGAWILFDNLDRGWPVTGLEEIDFVILRSLIDAARKLERAFSKMELSLNSIVFVRDDIYSELVSRTSDFGKDQPQRIDWRDADQLRELVRLRLVANLGKKEKSFQDAWGELCCSHHLGEETSQFFIERSMMRPRNLLNLINHCRSSAINLQHSIIESEDIGKGMETYSTDLLVELSREMQDVLPEYDTLLMDFVRSFQRMNHEELMEVFSRSGVQQGERDRVMQHLLYYGFVGIVIDQEEQYIYHYNYEIGLMLANIRKTGVETNFCIHPAFQNSLTLI